jgi:hypothetical protein
MPNSVSLALRRGSCGVCWGVLCCGGRGGGGIRVLHRDTGALRRELILDPTRDYQVDLANWTLLKWLGEPCPYYHWRQADRRPYVHPGDEHLLPAIAPEFEHGPTSRVLRLRAAAAAG